MTSRRCSICNKDSYCSESCEEKRSGWHIFTCTKRAITSADYLYRSITEDELPDDEQVLEDFGFNHFTSYAHKCKLMGLYKGLYLSEDISVEEVHKWQVEGSLVTNIKNYFYQMPERNRGGYFPWFLNHTDIFDRRITKEEGEDILVATFYDKSRPYLDEVDQNVDPKVLQPAAKRHAYLLLAEALHAAGPNPTEVNWNNFGFCTCHDEREERSLGGLYQQLLLGDKLFSDLPGREKFFRTRKMETATFEEFWHAYESGTLIQLMDSKGLKWQRTQFPFLEKFLSVPPSGPQPSVWSLKQFLAINDPIDFPPIPAVKVDYGFMNCENFEETCVLMEIYKRLLVKANPLELHDACLAGKLFEYAGRFDKMDENHRGLMMNFYPL
jgi:hypothetical protein